MNADLPYILTPGTLVSECGTNLSPIITSVIVFIFPEIFHPCFSKSLGTTSTCNYIVLSNPLLCINWTLKIHDNFCLIYF